MSLTPRPIDPDDVADEIWFRDLTPAEHRAAAHEWLRSAQSLRAWTRRGRETVALRLAAAQVHATLATQDVTP